MYFFHQMKDRLCKLLWVHSFLLLMINGYYDVNQFILSVVLAFLQRSAKTLRPALWKACSNSAVSITRTSSSIFPAETVLESSLCWWGHKTQVKPHAKGQPYDETPAGNRHKSTPGTSSQHFAELSHQWILWWQGHKQNGKVGWGKLGDGEGGMGKFKKPCKSNGLL